ncbi:exosortase Y [Pedobacter metabolipauper]|uniref:Exosortase/archaeosortase family protein n=1 Tax=Pedobacter metabolipauper TaxID=425513 RepID=A0A4R6SUJ0_9SPHI|nr:glycosyltransferase [Pedobacter metabolipauper]TDQ08633.1 exosortase/archaeosortase family protein [Pedobacter metabolipauper]
MKTADFSFIILTYNEEQHLPRLLDSILTLNAPVYILDSGSTDQTLTICQKNKLHTRIHSFKNHPMQWDYALKNFKIDTPWIIGLDADQIITPELHQLLYNFRDDAHHGINGIYFNRKNYFKGKWIKHGGFYPKYQLKMFRSGIGYSDQNENMDHRFQVPGKTIIWKNGHLIEENLKDNTISFWIEKHNKYSSLLAEEEIERKAQRKRKARSERGEHGERGEHTESPSFKVIRPKLWGMPNEHNAWLKRLWWNSPKYIRVFLYFTHRMIFQLGILDGKTGIIYHFLQGFWFRLIVDIKIDEMQAKQANARDKNHPLKFLTSFLLLFALLHSFNIAFIGVTTPGGIYIAMLDQHFNYIRYWRDLYVSSTALVLKHLNYIVTENSQGLRVKDHSGFRLIYSCLGYGLMSFFSAFVLAFPKPLYKKLIFLILGLISIQVLNTTRMVLIAIYYHPKYVLPYIDHHHLFNGLLYLLMGIMIYRWINFKPILRKHQKSPR